MKATNKLLIALCLALIACLAAPAMLPAGLNAAFTARAAAALNKRKATLYRGKTLQLKASLTPSDATDRVTWKSSNAKLAKVSQTGKVTGVKKGTVTITATAASGKAASVKITVN